MARDDSVLYTGVSSASLSSAKERELQKTKGEKQREKRERRAQLHPHAEIIKNELDKAINSLIYSVYPNEDTMSDEQFRNERKARRLAIASLERVQQRISNILREPKATKSQPAPEDFE